MKKLLPILLCVLSKFGFTQNQLGAIGSWREHYNNYSIFQVIKGDKYYAASTHQIICIDSSNHINYIGKSNGLHEIGIEQIAWDSIDNQLIIAYQNGSIDIKQGDQIFLINDIKRTSLYNNKHIEFIKVKSPLAFIGTGFGIVVLDINQHEIKETWLWQDQMQFNSTYPYFKSIIQNSTPFKVDINNGIALYPDSNNWIPIDGPNNTLKGKMSINEKYLIAPHANNTGGLSIYSTKGWENKKFSNSSSFEYSTIASGQDISWLSDQQYLYQFNLGNNVLSKTNTTNSTGTIVDLTTSLKGELAILNDQKGLQLFENNNWTTIDKPADFNFSNNAKMIFSNQGQVWIKANNNQGLYIYQSDKYYTNAAWVQKNTNANNGNLPSANVTSIVEDLTGAIWVGTDNGIGIFQCGDISKEACNAYLPIVNNNGFNAYLFQKETIRCMSVDGANRKWIGTNNGTWLVSPDGLDIIAHFTTENSPLPSDTVEQILIDPTSGEVFFNTSEELVSYRGTATAGSIHQEEALIFPNPVPPNFSGSISIKQLTENAMLKIVDLNGKLVFQTRALGGQAIWDGKTYEGEKVATGIYLIFIRDNTGTEKGVGKILITKGY